VDQKAKVAVWRAFPGIFGPEGAPVLEFVFGSISKLANLSPRI